MKVSRVKRKIKIIVLGFCLGLGLVAIQTILQIDKDVFMTGYWIAALIALTGVLLFNILYNVSYQRRMKQIAPLLEVGRPQEYIGGVERLLETAKGQNLRKILTMNLAAGYIDLKQFDKAIELLEGISDKKLVGTAVKTVYRLNLCTCYFQTAQGEKALALYHDSQKVFEPQRGGKLYGGNIAILDILAAIQGKEYDRAEALLDRARQTWPDTRFQSAFQEIANTLSEIEKENTP